MTDGLVEAFRNAVEVAICETESEYIIEPELALTILRAQGFAVVPVEPTEAMMEAARLSCRDASRFEMLSSRLANIYAAMIAAAGEGQ